MLKDQNYLLESKRNFTAHHYGEQVFLSNSMRMQTLLARFGKEETLQPELSVLLREMYTHLFELTVELFAPKSERVVRTRMAEYHDQAHYCAKLIDEETPLVFVDLARAGTEPTQICYQKAHQIFQAPNLRQDHFYINRVVNEKGSVSGVDVSGSKIGGDINKSLVFFPDPMGATGSSIERVYQYYQKEVSGDALEMIALHLVITPEYLKKITQTCPHLKVIALRLDRGLSPEEVLREPLGKKWDQERGLNANDYIVPGLGGVGEILNNSFC